MLRRIAGLVLALGCSSTIDARTTPGADGGASPEVGTADGGPTIPDALAPRLLRPRSGSYATTGAPTLFWALPPGMDRARVQVCEDRACARVEREAEVTGTRWRPPGLLGRGPRFWRVTAGGRSSPTWSFWPSVRGAPNDGALGQIADFDGDGEPELALLAREGELAVLGNLTGQSLRARPSPQGVFAVGLELAGDLDGDGDQELLVHRRDAQGDPGAWERFDGGPEGLRAAGTVDAPPSRSLVAVGDVDGDGRGDLALSGPPGTTTLTLLLEGRRRVEVPLPAGLSPAAAVPVPVWDVDGDGLDDIGVGVYGTHEQAYVLRTPTTAPRWDALRVDGGVPERPVIFRRLLGGDLDGDGLSDVVQVQLRYANDLRRYEDTVTWHRGARDGAAREGRVVLAPRPGDRGPHDVLVTDADGNGRWDLLLAISRQEGASTRHELWRAIQSDVELLPPALAQTLVVSGEGPGAALVGLGDGDHDQVGDLALWVGPPSPEAPSAATITARPASAPDRVRWTLAGLAAAESWFERPFAGSR